MKRRTGTTTAIYLNVENKKWLSEIADLNGCSISELVNKAVEVYKEVIEGGPENG